MFSILRQGRPACSHGFWSLMNLRSYCSPQENLYQVMGLKNDASDNDIKKAFFSLAKKYHPDVNKDPLAKKRFVEINNAYEILGDKNKKTQYDANLLRQRQHNQDFRANQYQANPFSSGSSNRESRYNRENVYRQQAEWHNQFRYQAQSHSFKTYEQILKEFNEWVKEAENLERKPESKHFRSFIQVDRDGNVLLKRDIRSGSVKQFPNFRNHTQWENAFNNYERFRSMYTDPKIRQEECTESKRPTLLQFPSEFHVKRIQASEETNYLWKITAPRKDLNVNPTYRAR
eukprot:TRINITY_DN9091_c0_g1_i9.p1 TRINITY_DN9091_c0_g1~~TRINITY_DN9091_c0_g1_i9.p1  ORF type:complete len:288 (+),score=38.42 TRINITY_DN9091_c0_g1_i9:121-984(+)